jgi:hypothetical protein
VSSLAISEFRQRGRKMCDEQLRSTVIGRRNWDQGWGDQGDSQMGKVCIRATHGWSTQIAVAKRGEIIALGGSDKRLQF